VPPVTPVFTRTWGREGGGGPVLVMVHGLVVAGSMLAPSAERLAGSVRVLAPDLPGYGRSRESAGAVSVPSLASDLLEWAAGAQVRRALWLGVSFGCQVLTEVALRRPDLVERMVLVAPTVDPTARTVPRILRRWQQESSTQSTALKRLLLADYARAGARRAAGTVRAALRDRPEQRLPHLTAPTLVVRGTADPITTAAWAQEVTRLLPRGRLVTVPEAPHAMTFDAPDALADAVRPFLDGQEDPL
jgi:2-hydroxy-6-oxonona-2,4-dienedioate hydrolase